MGVLMFDYRPEYAEELEKAIQNLPDGEIKDNAKHAIYRHIFEEVAKEYEETHNEDEEIQKNNECIRNFPTISTDISKLIYLIDEKIILYVLDIVRDIINIVDDMSYDRGYDDGFEECGKSDIDFIIDTSEWAGYESNYYKPIVKSGNELELIKKGLCCAVCKHYKDGYCCNQAAPRINMIRPKPYQVCVCVKFDGEKYSNYYFDGRQYCRRGNQTLEHKEHLANVAMETVNKLNKRIEENESFINFFKSEIPEVYGKMMKELRKRKEILE